MYSISAAATYLGVSIVTLRRWDATGRLISHRTFGNHRRYTFAQLQAVWGIADSESDVDVDSNESSTIRHSYIYARVSSNHQQTDGNLTRQVQTLTLYARKHYPHDSPVIIQEYGSGLNANRSGLRRLLHAIDEAKVSRILITYKDRLTRFGFPFLERICAQHNVPIIEIEQISDPSPEAQLITDLMTLMACFSGKLYKTRAISSASNKKDSSIIETKLINHEVQRAVQNTIYSLCSI